MDTHSALNSRGLAGQTAAPFCVVCNQLRAQLLFFEGHSPCPRRNRRRSVSGFAAHYVLVRTEDAELQLCGAHFFCQCRSCNAVLPLCGQICSDSKKIEIGCVHILCYPPMYQQGEKTQTENQKNASRKTTGVSARASRPSSAGFWLPGLPLSFPMFMSCR